MLRNALSKTVYIKVYENRFVLKLLEEGNKPITIVPSSPFSTARLLVGQFSAAEQALKKGFKDMLAGRWFMPSPVVVIQPMEKIEGGLAEVEERALRELALAAGARQAIVWVGHELSDTEVVRRAHGN
ncbi:MAG TPA: 1-pyrroline-5-carboxylate dehydrogenase [Gammaproteobacteria bacterium]|nr:1-pyrroline-5-carboxylate dehydrogenase [Gammaproteobacteria bacterium]